MPTFDNNKLINNNKPQVEIVIKVSKLNFRQSKYSFDFLEDKRKKIGHDDKRKKHTFVINSLL